MRHHTGNPRPPTPLSSLSAPRIIAARLIFGGPVSGKPDWPQRKDPQVEVLESSRKSGLLSTTVRWSRQEVSSVASRGAFSQLCRASFQHELRARDPQPDI